MKPFSLNIRGRLISFDRPAIMGIINVTPDSFYEASRCWSEERIAAQAVRMVREGALILDVGACSTRPGADPVSEDEEVRRLVPAVETIRRVVGADVFISVDTFRAGVAEKAVGAGADIVNDVSGGNYDAEMFSTVARLRVPYILTHNKAIEEGNDDAQIVAAVVNELSMRLEMLREIGVADVIVDPGFGFSKTLEQNYAIFRQLEHFGLVGAPILVGVSRKSMITKALGITTEDALNATNALNMVALQKGASILRVHDVLSSVHCAKLYQLTK